MRWRSSGARGHGHRAELRSVDPQSDCGSDQNDAPVPEETTSKPVPHLNLANEIGEIARALDRGKHEAEASALTIAAMNQSPTMLMITDPDENITFLSASLVEMC